ncbi:MAG: FHA domain-containing protein [Vicinamibacteria bacterium]
MTEDSRAAELVWERPDGGRQAFALEREMTLVGRGEEADVRIDEPLVSRLHARIEHRTGRYFVVDLGSTNLTRVNGDVVQERELRDGDELLFSRARCRFQQPPRTTDEPD